MVVHNHHVEVAYTLLAELEDNHLPAEPEGTLLLAVVVCILLVGHSPVHCN